MPCQDELSAEERAILEVETSWWTIAATKERAIEQRLGISTTRYYLLLSQLLDDERAWHYDPPLIGRLRDLRDQRLAERGSTVFPENSHIR
ncbi:MAG: DUF3263 domain-containing protein [Actinomycetaceae bacterium]|nr:DUF3263 domain-containing protein [Actinomycetaceae bacterium]